MATRNQKSDQHVQRILAVLDRYAAEHPRARGTVYRYNSASIRIRILDPGFTNKSIPEREDMVWSLLETLPEATRSQITVLLLLTPEEAKKSLLSLEFDDPSPSRL